MSFSLNSSKERSPRRHIWSFLATRRWSFPTRTKSSIRSKKNAKKREFPSIARRVVLSQRKAGAFLALLRALFDGVALFTSLRHKHSKCVKFLRRTTMSVSILSAFECMKAPDVQSMKKNVTAQNRRGSFLVTRFYLGLLPRFGSISISATFSLTKHIRREIHAQVVCSALCAVEKPLVFAIYAIPKRLKFLPI